VDKPEQYTHCVGEPKYVIPEDGLAEYIICPLRYAFVWHYEVDPPGQAYAVRACLRTGLSELARLQYEHRLTAATVSRVLRPMGGRLENTHFMYVHGALVKYAAVLAERQVLAFSAPSRVRVGDSLFVGVADVIHKEEDSIVFSHMNGLPFATASEMDAMIVQSVRDGMSSLEASVKRNGLRVVWRSLHPQGAAIVEEDIRPMYGVRPLLGAISRGIRNHAFYPRWHSSVCRRCGFQSVCSPKWCSARVLRRPGVAREGIVQEMQ